MISRGFVRKQRRQFVTFVGAKRFIVLTVEKMYRASNDHIVKSTTKSFKLTSPLDNGGVVVSDVTSK